MSILIFVESCTSCSGSSFSHILYFLHLMIFFFVSLPLTARKRKRDEEDECDSSDDSWSSDIEPAPDPPSDAAVNNELIPVAVDHPLSPLLLPPPPPAVEDDDTAVNVNIPSLRDFMLGLMEEQVRNNWTDTSMIRLFDRLKTKYLPDLPTYKTACKMLTKLNENNLLKYPSCPKDHYIHPVPRARLADQEMEELQCGMCKMKLFITHSSRDNKTKSYEMRKVSRQ